MLAIVGKILGTVFGINSAQSVASNVGGVFTNMTAIAGISYLVKNANEVITFTASLGFLAILAGFAYILIELVRRSTGNTQ